MFNRNVLTPIIHFTLWTSVVITTIAIPSFWASAQEQINVEPKLISGHTDPSEMSMTGDTDYDFAVNMRIHHQMGVEMAQAEVSHGTDPEMLNLARNIITAQSEEIATLDKWIATHKPKEQPSTTSQ